MSQESLGQRRPSPHHLRWSDRLLISMLAALLPFGSETVMLMGLFAR